jgi:hypothetical protein
MIRLTATGLPPGGSSTVYIYTWERKIKRKINKPIYENGYWRIKMNQNFYKIPSPGIDAIMKVCRVE